MADAGVGVHLSASTAKAAKTFLALAESMSGVRYRWGGGVTSAAVKPALRGRRHGWR